MHIDMTPIQWFKRVSDPHLREKLLARLAAWAGEEDFYHKYHNVTFPTLSQALMNAFTWSATPEGYDYWRERHEDWRVGVALPALSPIPSVYVRREALAHLRSLLLRSETTLHPSAFKFFEILYDL